MGQSAGIIPTQIVGPIMLSWTPLGLSIFELPICHIRGQMRSYCAVLEPTWLIVMVNRYISLALQYRLFFMRGPSSQKDINSFFVKKNINIIVDITQTRFLNSVAVANIKYLALNSSRSQI